MTWDLFERIAAIAGLAIGAAGFAAGVAITIRYVISAGRSGGFKAATEAAAAWKAEAEALGAKVDRLIAEHRDEVAMLTKRVDEAISQRDQERGRADEAVRVNTELRELVMGERVPDALSSALTETSTVVIEYFDTLVAGFKGQLQTSLEAHTGLLAMMEEEYLRPIKSRLERRSEELPFEGKDRRKNGG